VSRVKRSVHARKKRRKVLKEAKGYFGRKHSSYRFAKEQVQRSGMYAYRDRRNRKRDMRRLWIERINAASRIHGMPYGRFIAGLKAAGLPEAAAQLVALADRAAVGELVTLDDCIDIVVPRGGKALIERLMRESRIPMIKHLDGVCHVYIDERADIEKAIRIADNAKTQRYGTCNTMETLLVAEGIAPRVLPEIGRLDPHPARAAIRDVFIHHVIGGKKLSRRADFPAMVRAATPDAVLAGVEVLADGAGDVPGAGDVLVVDVGGATTDVYSVVTPQGEDAVLHKEVVEVMWRSRTVEGDLGMRWSAGGVVDAAAAERLLLPGEERILRAVAERRHADTGFVPDTEEESGYDARLAELAVTVALRRHGRGGKDLREVALVVGSGGVLRHGSPELRNQVLRPATHDLAGGWPVPEHARAVVDVDYVLAAAGLLASDQPETAVRLLRSLATDH